MTAPVSDTITLNITRDTVGVARAGFGTPLLLSATAAWSGGERTRTYTSLADVAVDFPNTTGPEYLAAAAVFGQTPKPRSLKIGRSALPPTMRYSVEAAAVRNSHAYTIDVVGDGVTSTAISSTSDSAATAAEVHNALLTALNAVVGKNFTAAFAALVVADFTFTASGATLTHVAHGLQTGDGPVRLTNSGGALPTGLATATDYYAIRLGADTFSLATSLANALAGTAITTSDAGTGTHTLSDTASTVRPSDAFTVTGDAAGDWFSLEVDSDDLTLALTHADPGVATDLGAIVLADPDWYCLITFYNSIDYVEAAAAWVETQKRIYIADTCNGVTITATVGTLDPDDIADSMFDQAYTRTAVAYHESPAEMLGAAWAGRVLPTEPGAATWKFKRLAGVSPSSLTSTHRTNLRAKSANWFERSGGRNMTFDGKVAADDYIDVTRDLDWLEDDMLTGVFGAITGVDKVDFDDDGIGVIETEVRASLRRAVDRRILKVDPAPSVEVPLAADITDTDLADRHLPDVKWSAKLRGAIHSVTINGTVSL